MSEEPGGVRSSAWRPVAVLGVVAVLAFGCDGQDEAVPSPTTPLPTTPSPTTPLPASPSPTATPTPITTPSETEDAREAELEELRATNRFLELAEADRAKTATWARFGYHQFAPHADGEVLFEWANKDELWNSIAPRIRDECLLAGPPATRPMWDTKVVIPAAIDPAWNDQTTGGRGQVMELSCNYMDEGQPVESIWGVLIATDDQKRGSVALISDPFVILERHHDDFDSSRQAVDGYLWDWAMAGGERET